MLDTIKRLVKNVGWLTTAYRTFRDRRIASAAAVPNPLGFRFIGPAAMQEGAFELKETEFLIERASRFDAFVNIGANCGYFACIARQLGLHVTAVEPHPLNYGPLLRNMEVNGWNDVEIFPMALSRKPGFVKLYGSGTGASLVAGWAQSSHHDYIIVPVCTLDRIVGPSLDGKRVLYWIDVEGAEFEVLCGAAAQLGRAPSPTWVIEIMIDDLQPRGTRINPRARETFELFWSHGYEARNLGNGSIVTRDLVNKWQTGQDPTGGGNFIFER
jgi:FkbM family methyltransferase